jgi:DNA-binding NarL/FixJ family response regulator
MVGLSQPTGPADRTAPDVVICDYDLLSALPLHKWEQHPLLSSTPVVAVSLTRKSQELHLTEVDGIAGFLYLPTLEPDQALQILRAATSRPKYSLPLSAATTTVERG